MNPAVLFSDCQLFLGLVSSGQTMHRFYAAQRSPFKEVPAAAAALPDQPGNQRTGVGGQGRLLGMYTTKPNPYKDPNRSPGKKLWVFSRLWRREVGRKEQEQGVVSTFPSLHLRFLPILGSWLEPQRQVGRTKQSWTPLDPHRHKNGLSLKKSYSGIRFPIPPMRKFPHLQGNVSQGILNAIQVFKGATDPRNSEMNL